MYLIILVALFVVDGRMADALSNDGRNDVYGTLSDGEDLHLYGEQEADTNRSIVDIARFIDSSQHVRRYPVYVDDTMTRLIFQVAVEGPSPEFDIIHPTDGSIHIEPVIETKDTYNISTYDIPINSTDYGKWYFMNRYDHLKWNVTIQGESPVSIYQELFEVGSNERIQRPFADREYRVVVTVKGMANIQTIDSTLKWYSETKYQLVKILPTNQTSANTFEVEATRVFFQPFYLRAVGTDYSNNSIQRINPRLIHPIVVSIDVPDYTGIELHENEYLNVTFTVTSHHSTAEYIEIEIEDTANFTIEPKAFNFTLSTGENSSDVFSMQMGGSGSSTIVRIHSKFGSAYHYRSLNDGPEVVRSFTVKPDNISAMTQTSTTSTQMSNVQNNHPTTGSATTTDPVTSSVATGPTSTASPINKVHY
ncbi:hypothetical protein ACF0H5_021017 [Mactra antiquata]